MNQSAMVTVPCVVTVAAGVFAPGHLGELTRYLPFELVDDVLEMTGAVQKRMRALPSRVGMYFVLAMTLFPGIGYLRVWDKMTGALEDLGLPRPSEKALRDLRRRLGPAPAKAVFETVAVPLASPWTRGVTWRGLRTVAFDGLNSVHVPDSDRNRSWLGKLRNRLGVAGYPAMRIVALAETGTRGLLGAVIGGQGERAEVPLARKLVPLLGEGMLLLADRAYDAADLLAAIAATGAHFLVRGSASRKPAVGEILPDGSYLSQVDGLQVRIIEADLDVHGADGTRIGDSYRLITTLLDWRRYPAGELIRLYHERWEIEVAYLALRHTLLGRYVLRSRDRAGAEQELWALLAVYQALRMAMTAAAESAGADPDRASFTTALEAARDQVTAARGVADSGDPADIGRIGRAVLDGLLPARRPRYSARKVKCSTSRYHVRDRRPAAANHRRSPACRSPSSSRRRTGPQPAAVPGRTTRRASSPPAQARHQKRQVTHIMASEPGHDWSGSELASRLGVQPRNLLTQLAEWTRLGLLAKTGRGRYAPLAPPAPCRLSRAVTRTLLVLVDTRRPGLTTRRPERCVEVLAGLPAPSAGDSAEGGSSRQVQGRGQAFTWRPDLRRRRIFAAGRAAPPPAVPSRRRPAARGRRASGR